MQKTFKHKYYYDGCKGMKPINCFMFLLVVLFFLSGCSAVTSLNPVGTNPIQIQKDDWEGCWCSGVEKEEMFLFVWVKDKDKGVLRIGVVAEVKEEKDLILMKFDVQLRQGKSSVFGNILFKEFAQGDAKEDETNELLEKSYFWFMIKNVDGSIVIYLPNAVTFKELVKEGKLKGETVKNSSNKFASDDIVICEPTDKITQFIDSYDYSGKLFDWESPLTFWRIVKGIPFFNE